MPANEYTLYNSPLTVLCRLALPMAVCAALAVALLSEPPDSIPFAIIISGIIFLSAFFLLFIRALLDRRPQLTLSPKGLFIHTKFSENILDGTYRPRKRKEAFYTWRNLGSPKLDPLPYMLTLMANDLPEFPEAPPPLPDNATDEQAEAFLAEMGRYVDAVEKGHASHRQRGILFLVAVRYGPAARQTPAENPAKPDRRGKRSRTACHYPKAAI